MIRELQKQKSSVKKAQLKLKDEVDPQQDLFELDMKCIGSSFIVDEKVEEIPFKNIKEVFKAV